MLTYYSDDHRLHHGQAELNEGQLVPCHERPERADRVIKALRSARLGDIVAPDDFGLKPILAVHSPNYVEFLRIAWELWSAEGRDWDALPLNWPVRGMRQVEPDYIDGKLSFFSFDAGTPITAGTWRAVTAGANVAVSAASRLLFGDPTVFALCRPPGHHAAADYYGGYCFLNNAAIAAQYLRDHGANRVAIVDVDYHHGNGTQSIFYERDDVFFTSIHGDPRQEFPYFLGHAVERGAAAGEGHNLNLPLPWGTAADAWFVALETALEAVADYTPDYLIVSLGVDTFEGDPISQFKLTTADYSRLGKRIAEMALPTQFVFEGGYAVDDVGNNVVNVLQSMAASR